MIGKTDRITFNLHLNGACNMRCMYCFGKFQKVKPLGFSDWRRIVGLIDDATGKIHTRRMNLVGGEPLMVPFLEPLIDFIRSRGIDVSIVTNGSLLSPDRVRIMRGRVNMIGVSIDSIVELTNRKIGRVVAGHPITGERYQWIIDSVLSAGIELKINTVVSQLNRREILEGFMKSAGVCCWKVMKMIHVAGENDGAKHLVSTDEQYQQFCSRNSTCLQPIFEDEEIMRNSYIMISPDGRFFDSSQGGYFTSSPILETGIKGAFRGIHFDLDAFLKKAR